LEEEDKEMKGRILIIELRIVRIHIEESILIEGNHNWVDPNKWKPLMMSFQKFYGFGKEINYSRLSNIPEAFYEISKYRKSRK
jgi:flavin reductase (DIM6/NTAB) family NADH-FMN oxidoreductase RutF